MQNIRKSYKYKDISYTVNQSSDSFSMYFKHFCLHEAYEFILFLLAKSSFYLSNATPTVPNQNHLHAWIFEYLSFVFTKLRNNVSAW